MSSDPDDVLSGKLRAGVLALAEVAGTEVGLWTLSEGTVCDVESDEVFVVLACSLCPHVNRRRIPDRYLCGGDQGL